MGTAVRVAILTLVLGLGVAPPARGQGTEEQETVGWTNATELSLVATEGNSNTATLGFKDTLKRRWPRYWLTLRLDTVFTNSADDRFKQVDPGFTWEPGATPPPFTATLVEPPTEPDVEKYFAEGRFDRKLGKRVSWNTGGSWERNSDAGIINRYVVFGGMGHVWRDSDDLSFHTSYGLSVTDREEEIQDPEKEDRFTGVRLGSKYSVKLGAVTTFKDDFTFNISVADGSDYSFDMVNSVGVAMSKRLSLKVSLQWLYNNEPALEEVDVVARVIIIDPDGVPGSGDEFFQTVTSGGSEIEIGTENVRKKPLDTVFNASLVINI